MAKKTTNKASKTSVKKVKKSRFSIGKPNSKNVMIIAICAVIVVAIIIAIVVSNKGGFNKNVVPVENVQELNDKLNVKMQEPVSADNVKYGIENGNIARIDYQKKAYDGSMMNFTLRSSSSMEENMSGLTNEWGTPILMTVICNDGSEVEVISYVASDDSNIMKGDWYDNDKYYTMTTDNLVTREDFLQEINRVVIANHVEF